MIEIYIENAESLKKTNKSRKFAQLSRCLRYNEKVSNTTKLCNLICKNDHSISIHEGPLTLHLESLYKQRSRRVGPGTELSPKKR